MNYKDLSSPQKDNFNVEDLSNSAEFNSAKRYKAIFLADIPMYDLISQVPGLSSINKVVTLKDKFQINSIVDFFREKSKTLIGEEEQQIKILIFCESLKKVTANDIDIIFMKEDSWSLSTTSIKDMKYTMSTSLRYFGVGVIGVKDYNFRWFLKNNSGKIIESFNGFVTDVATTQSKVKVEDVFMDALKYKQFFGKASDLGDKEIFFNTDTLQNKGFKDLFLNEVEALDALWTDVSSVNNQKISQLHNVIASPVNFFRADETTLELYGINPDKAMSIPFTKTEGNYIVNTDDIGGDLTTELNYLMVPRDEFSKEYVIYHEDAVMRVAAEYFNYMKILENEEKFTNEIYLPECNYPEWMFLEKNILNVTNRADISARLDKTIINGCIYQNDQTENVVGSNFSFDIYNYLIQFFAANSNNSDDLTQTLKIRLNNKITKMMDGKRFGTNSTRVVSITEEAGYYEAYIKIYDPDQERDYIFTLILA